MSVIAKMQVQDVREFGRANLIRLGCVYESNGLNSNDNGWENRRFTTATPWGEGDLTTPRDSVFRQRGDGAWQEVYLVFRPVDELPGGAEPLLAMPVRVKSLDKDSYRRVEIVLDRQRAGPEKDTALNVRLSIDNPAALEQFGEGSLFDLSIYDASKTALAEAAA